MSQLAQMNSLLSLSGNLPERLQYLQGRFCANFLDEQLYEGRLQTKFGRVKSDERPVFFRQQLLFLLRLCALECSENAPLIVDGKTEAGFELGRCCLMMSDHLHSRKQEQDISQGTPSKVRKHLLIQMAPTRELNNPPSIQRSMVRSDIIFSDILHSEAMVEIIKNQLKGFDLDAKFQQSTGLTLQEYRDIVFMTLTWYYTQDWERLIEDPSRLIINRSNYIRKSRITQEQFDKYLALDSVGLMQLPEKIEEQKKLFPHILPQFDFVVFRKYPLLELGYGNLICVDPTFLIEKLGSGFHWTIINSFTDKKDRERSFKTFGHLFELYVDRIMQEIYPPKSKLLLSFPNFQNGNESFDGVVNLGEHLIVMEYKGGGLTQDAKYSGKVKTFEKDIDRDRKFGVGEGAGVYQLANKIERLFHRDKSLRDTIIGLSSSSGVVTKITPVLIVQEPYLRFDFVNMILNERFQKLINKKQITDAIEVAPLQVIDIDSLEMITMGIKAGVFRFDQCLNLRAFDDGDLLSSFATYPWSHFFPNFKGVTDPDIEARSKAIFERYRQDYF